MMRRACEGLRKFLAGILEDCYGDEKGPLALHEDGRIDLVDYYACSDGNGAHWLVKDQATVIQFCPFCGCALPHPAVPRGHSTPNWRVSFGVSQAMALLTGGGYWIWTFEAIHRDSDSGLSFESEPVFRSREEALRSAMTGGLQERLAAFPFAPRDEAEIWREIAKLGYYLAMHDRI
jgi:hypothetical protein